MKRLFSSAKEARLLHLNKNLEFGTDDQYLQSLKGFQRTKESSFGAAGHLMGGAGQLVTGKNGRFRGALRMGQGALDLGDAITSPLPDAIRSFSGMPTGKEKPARYNITRAFNDINNIRTDDVEHAVKDGIAWTAGMAHALFFKAGSDGIKAVRDFSKN